MVRGKNNCVKVKNKKQSGKLKIYVSGSNNEIIIENISIMQNLDVKNCKVPRDSIVGSNAIVAKRFDTPNVVIAGNPAQIIKENVTWTKENVGFFN